MHTPNAIPMFAHFSDFWLTGTSQILQFRNQDQNSAKTKPKNNKNNNNNNHNHNHNNHNNNNHNNHNNHNNNNNPKKRR